jgi:hypothetical protein
MRELELFSMWHMKAHPSIIHPFPFLKYINMINALDPHFFGLFEKRKQRQQNATYFIGEYSNHENAPT